MDPTGLARELLEGFSAPILATWCAASSAPAGWSLTCVGLSSRHCQEQTFRRRHAVGATGDGGDARGQRVTNRPNTRLLIHSRRRHRKRVHRVKMISPCSPATLYLGSRCECALALTSTEADPDVGCQRGKSTVTVRVAVGRGRGVDSNPSLPPVRVGSLGRIARLLTVVCILPVMASSWVKIEIGGVVGEVTALVGKTDDLRACVAGAWSSR
jgi:hypothetical protein